MIPHDPTGEPLALLTVHAHPDDEASKGSATVACYHDEGVRCVLVCCTGGEAGDILNPAVDTPEVRARLSEVRMEELRASVDAIGYDELHMLGYHDSGMPDTDVPEARILMEDHGRNTFESIARVSVIFRDHGLRSGLFVSDRTHMLRVLRMASDQGILAWGSPTTTSPTDADPVRRQQAVVHELAGLLAYYFGGDTLIDESAINGSP